MRELKLSLAQNLDSLARSGFCVTADTAITEVSANETRAEEGQQLADILMDHLPGGTIEAMIARMRERYATLYNQDLNPFLDREGQ